MKRLLLFISFITLCFHMYAVEEVFASITTSFRAETGIEAGFTHSAVSGISRPAGSYPDGTEISFVYNTSTSSFEIDNLHYYVQVFTIEGASFSITCDDMVSVSAKIPSSDIVMNISGENGGSYRETEAPYRYPRVYTGDIRLSIPMGKITDTTAAYRGRLTLEVTSI